MHIVTYFPWLRRPGYFSEAEATGSFVVHHDLLESGLSTGKIERVTILTDRFNTFSVDRPAAVINAALDTLSKEVRSKVSVQSSSTAFEKRSNQANLILLGKSSEWSELQALRRTRSLFAPIVAIVHSAWFPGISTTYRLMRSEALPGDTLICTSDSSEVATRTLFAQAQEQAERELGLSNSVQVVPALKRVPLAIPDVWMEPIDKKSARSALQISEKALVLLYFGRLSREYKADLSSLLLITKKLKKQFPGLQLILAGSDVHLGLQHSLQQEINACGLGECVRLLKNVPAVVKRILFFGADVFVSPADNIVESFGITLLEALGAGVPIVCSDWSGYREIIDDGVDGFLVPTYSRSSIWAEVSQLAETAITPLPESLLAQSTFLDTDVFYQRLRTLLLDSDLRQRMGKAGRQKASTHYVWSKAICKFGAIFASAADQCVRRLPGGESLRLDLSESFAHYPSHWLRGSMDGIYLCKSTVADDEIVTELIRDDAIRALLQWCGAAPRPYHAVVASWPSKLHVIDQLLKGGYLVLCRSVVRS